VAFAPSLYQGRTTATIDRAEALLAYFRAHPAVQGDGVAALGFSMGAAWAAELASSAPADIKAVVIFYGTVDADFTKAQAAYLGHFGENDDFEPLDGARQTNDESAPPFVSKHRKGDTQ